ncbi:MAG: electron transfer flavoprotein subunit beta [Syntrophobacterales bacterium CG_4_8_14_3_um_filter_49_14]|nr:MAG: electron transfer flavoprotein subunit beta [Syntrophobacterales bacterium CG23_combo_of_CG06-09_8_20_14_all_48_27]PJC74433.1 MAG: electron transfer flavoprotein subunit beta [Syntrophobacterales bacterium CG_4_8_14_3_um_filter_49_14]
MNIVVCVKQVPEEIRINKKTGALIREGIKGIMNPCDKNALELAVTLKEKHGGKVTIVSMGPQDVESTLTHGLAMGADQAVLLCDRRFAGADSLVTSFVLSEAIKKLGDFQLVLCGRETADSGTQHVGPQIAHYLKIPQITYVIDLTVNNGKLRAKRQIKDEYETVETGLPALVTVLKGINEPRMPTYLDIYETAKKDTHKWRMEDLGLREELVSPTKIINVFTPEAKRSCKMIKGSVEEVSHSLIQELRSKELV